RDKPFQVWGRANAGTTVEVEWDKKSQQIAVGIDGGWKLTFPAPTLNKKPQTLRIKNSDQELISDQILVGDVWLAAGKSNLEHILHQAFHGDSLATTAVQYKQTRLLSFNSHAETTNSTWDTTTLATTNELRFFEGEWTQSKVENALCFSAVGYAFA